jgi:hypothetical protein
MSTMGGLSSDDDDDEEEEVEVEVWVWVYDAGGDCGG